MKLHVFGQEESIIIVHVDHDAFIIICFTLEKLVVTANNFCIYTWKLVAMVLSD
jgi:hypothetical protein